MQHNKLNCETVSGEIIEILEKESKYGSTYFDVHFKMINTGSFYRSCVYTECRNYSNWKNLLHVGNILSNLKLITKYGKLFIDADSCPLLMRSGNPLIKHKLKSVRNNRNDFTWIQGVLIQ